MLVSSASVIWDPREILLSELSQLQETLSTSIIDEATSFRSLKMFPNGIVEELAQNALSPLSISITGSIVHDMASVTISKVYWNNTDIPIRQAFYIIPLPSSCTVTDFSCRIGQNKVLRASARPKEESWGATKKSDITSQITAMLDQTTPEIFTVPLGSIPPDTKLETKLTYITLLERQFSRDADMNVNFSIPTAIVNRYRSTPTGFTTSGFHKTPCTFTLQLDIFEAGEKVEIKSDNHQVVLDRNSNKHQALEQKKLFGNNYQSSSKVSVKLDPTVEFLREDFILNIKSSFSSKSPHPHAWIESHPLLESQKAMMIAIPPSLMKDQAQISEAGDLLFLLDRSSSVSDKIEAVRLSLKFGLKGIPLSRTFNIWSFGTGYAKLWEKSQVYSAQSLREALYYVDTQFKADMGESKLLGVLNDMWERKYNYHTCDVIILTSGQVWHLDETLALVQKIRYYSHGKVRVFALGIGAHVSHALMQGIGSRGGGYSEVIPMESLGGWEDRLVSMLKAALTSHDWTLNILLNDRDCDRFLTSQTDIARLSPYQGNRVFILSESDSSLDNVDSVTIESLIPNGERICITVPISRLPIEDTTIHSFAVQAMVDDVEYPSNFLTILDQSSATDLACRFSILTKWTSFVVQEERVKSKEKAEPTQTGISAIGAANELGLLQPLYGKRLAMIVNVGETQDWMEGQARLQSFDKKGASGIIHDKQDKRKVAKLTSHWSGLNLGNALNRTAKKQVKVLTSVYESLKSHSRNNTLKEATPNPNSRDPHGEFVEKLLTYQNFDGSFNVEVQFLLEPSWVQAADNIIGRTSVDILTYLTVLVIVSLERHLPTYKDLCDLMMTKAVSYVELRVPNVSKRTELTAFVGDLLADDGIASSKLSADTTTG